MRVSAVVLTKNEEENIKRCIESLNFCDEVVVVDDYSTDKTVKIIENSGVKTQIYQRSLNGDFAAQRNFGLKKAKGDWILFIDGDEVVTDELKNEIKRLITLKTAETNNKVYYIKRRDYWWGRELRFGEVERIRRLGLIRLVRKKSGKWEGKVHEVFKTSNSAGRLNYFLNHYPHQKLKDFLKEINLYSSLRAKELLSFGKKITIFEIVFYPLGKFILNYFFKLGVLDGAAGFVYAFLMSFHSFLVRAKLFQYRFDESKSEKA